MISPGRRTPPSPSHRQAGTPPGLPASSKAFARRFASNTTACAPSRSTSTGSGDSCASMACAIRATWGAAEVEAFLSDLAVSGHVAAATQNQAKSAILFLYREVLGIELAWLDGVTRAREPARVPVVLTRDEVGRVLARLRGTHRLIGHLLYGSGLRIMEGV